MRKTCQKCGTESDVDDSPSAACPSCGVIFAKVDQISVAQRQALRAAAASARKAPDSPATAETPARSPAVERILWALTAIGAMTGFAQLGLTLDKAESAPQQAAGFALAIAYAVLPYVLARAAQEYRK